MMVLSFVPPFVRSSTHIPKSQTRKAQLSGDDTKNHSLKSFLLCFTEKGPSWPKEA